jgi:hypothetical protein
MRYSTTSLAQLADILEKGLEGFLPSPTMRQQQRATPHAPAAPEPLDAIEAACFRLLRTLGTPVHGGALRLGAR